MGPGGRDVRWSTREGDHPPKVAGSGTSERSSRVSEDKGAAHCHGRVPIAVLGSNQREDHERSLVTSGRATKSFGSISLSIQRRRIESFRDQMLFNYIYM